MAPDLQGNGADQLEDDFVPDDLVALSGDEGEAELAPEDVPGGEISAEDEAVTPDANVVEKKRKRREKEKERKTKKRKLAETTGSKEPQSVATNAPAALEQYLAEMQAKTFSDLSAIELDDRRIPETAIADTTAWAGARTLDQLEEFITTALPTLRTRLGQRPKNVGAPTLLVVSAAALRVADITRVLKSKTLRGVKGGDVAKLFAKHFKVDEQVQYLRRASIGAAVGTPGRLGKLLCDTDALALSALTHVILDVSHRDAKKRSLLDIPETRNEVFKLVLGAPKLAEVIKQGKVQVVLF